MNKKEYIAPRTEAIALCFESHILDASGETITIDPNGQGDDDPLTRKQEGFWESGFSAEESWSE